MASQVESIKWVPGTDFLVDGFVFKHPRCSHYFLTHFHSDHTVGLNKNFDGGAIFCSPITARLLVHDLGIKPQLVRPLAVGRAEIIAGVRVTTLDANHCPGAVMFLFEVPLAIASATTAKAAKPLALAGAAGGVSIDSLPCISGIPVRPGSSSVPALWVTAGAENADFGPQVHSGSQEGEGTGRTGDSGGSPGSVAADGVRSCAHARAGPSVALDGGPGDSGDSRSDTVLGAVAATHNVLHTGDCRWQRWMREQPGLAGVRVDTLFLDTTYAAPKHTLPPQQDAIEAMVQVMRDALAAEPATVFVVAAYHIGKERAFLGAAQQLGARVWCSPAKRSVLRLLDLPPEQLGLLVEEPREAAVHVTGWGLRPEDLQAHLNRHPGVWKQAVGIRPTGWTLRRSGSVSIRREGNVAVVGVPYSEHSSWTDLCDAVSQLRPRALIPTVNAATPAQRRALVDRFAHLMDLSADRSRLDVYLARGAAAARQDGEEGPSDCEAAAAAAAGGSAQRGGGSGAVLCVDLGAVNLAEQERILEDLQRRNRRQRERQQQRQQRREQRHAGNKRKPGGPAEGAADEERVTGGKRPQPDAQQLQPPVAPSKRSDAAISPGGAAGGASGTRSSFPPSRPGRTAACSFDASGGAVHRQRSFSGGKGIVEGRGGGGGGGGGGDVDVIDLSLDDENGSVGGASGDVHAGTDARVLTRPVMEVCVTPCRSAIQRSASRKAEAAGNGTQGGQRQALPDIASTQVAAATAWQSGIRRFFAPVSRVAAAAVREVLAAREAGVCVHQA